MIIKSSHTFLLECISPRHSSFICLLITRQLVAWFVSKLKSVLAFLRTFQVPYLLQGGRRGGALVCFSSLIHI